MVLLNIISKYHKWKGKQFMLNDWASKLYFDTYPKMVDKYEVWLTEANSTAKLLSLIAVNLAAFTYLLLALFSLIVVGSYVAIAMLFTGAGSVSNYGRAMRAKDDGDMGKYEKHMRAQDEDDQVI